MEKEYSEEYEVGTKAKNIKLLSTQENWRNKHFVEFTNMLAEQNIFYQIDIDIDKNEKIVIVGKNKWVFSGIKLYSGKLLRIDVI